MPLPTPLLPFLLFPPDAAIAGDDSEVERSIVMAGGTVSEYLPQSARKDRRSVFSAPCDSGVDFTMSFIPKREAEEAPEM